MIPDMMLHISQSIIIMIPDMMLHISQSIIIMIPDMIFNTPVCIIAMIHMTVDHGYDSSHDFNTPQNIMVMI